MEAVALAVIGYQCMVRTTEKTAGAPVQIDRPLGRRYNVKDAAEQLAALARKEGQDTWVREVMGPAERGLASVVRKGKRTA